MFRVIQEINKAGTTILLVEQNARMALKIGARGYVLETGKITMHDQACNLLANKDMAKAYLGRVFNVKDKRLRERVEEVEEHDAHPRHC